MIIEKSQHYSHRKYPWKFIMQPSSRLLETPMADMLRIIMQISCKKNNNEVITRLSQIYKLKNQNNISSLDLLGLLSGSGVPFILNIMLTVEFSIIL